MLTGWPVSTRPGQPVTRPAGYGPGWTSDGLRAHGLVIWRVYGFAGRVCTLTWNDRVSPRVTNFVFCTTYIVAFTFHSILSFLHCFTRFITSFILSYINSFFHLVHNIFILVIHLLVSKHVHIYFFLSKFGKKYGRSGRCFFYFQVFLPTVLLLLFARFSRWNCKIKGGSRPTYIEPHTIS